MGNGTDVGMEQSMTGKLPPSQATVHALNQQRRTELSLVSVPEHVVAHVEQPNAIGSNLVQALDLAGQVVQPPVSLLLCLPPEWTQRDNDSMGVGKHKGKN